MAAWARGRIPSVGSRAVESAIGVNKRRSGWKSIRDNSEKHAGILAGKIVQYYAEEKTTAEKGFETPQISIEASRSWMYIHRFALRVLEAVGDHIDPVICRKT